jgi:hypothetical protein
VGSRSISPYLAIKLFRWFREFGKWGKVLQLAANSIKKYTLIGLIPVQTNY